MLYPNSKRLDPAQAKQFYKEHIKPRLPDARAMPNDGHNTPLRKPFSDDTADLLASNIQRTILLTF